MFPTLLNVLLFISERSFVYWCWRCTPSRWPISEKNLCAAQILLCDAAKDLWEHSSLSSFVAFPFSSQLSKLLYIGTILTVCTGPTDWIWIVRID